ncbi:SPT7 [Candida pseudojiufengensis]|uniref:SPT7 n=1 Tax=Candida pseudojiufengensis TaxID=497109 RepID=UPI0022258136|nr:SPT7 [Candida pseudojiufengensis]KAI5961917.1 SPT7 [Candida pseudojiufengensis]
MEKLNFFRFNNPKTLYNLALKLNNQQNFFQSFLNENQFTIINYILSLENFEVWSYFLDGNVYLKYNNDRTDETGTEEDKSIEKSVLDNLEESEIDEYSNDNSKRVSTSADRNTPLTNKNSKSKETEGESKLLLSTQNELETNPDIIFEEGTKMIKKLALHIRYLLWEKAIDFYYELERSNNELNKIDEIDDDYELIDSIEDNDHEETKKVVELEVIKPKIREEEEDYDFDEDEEEQDNKTSNLEEKAHQSEDDKILQFNEENQLILEIPLSIFKSKEQPPRTSESENNERSSSRPQTSEPETNKDDQDKLIREFNKVYHNFEYDRETLIKRRKLEQSDLQMENVKIDKNDTSKLKSSQQNQSNNNMDIALGMSSTSLRSLLSKIHYKRDKIALNDHELRTLFMDVRKNRGKWANDERVGQEELYEACEKVVTELRNFTEHSTFFLNKVSKREAPNYGLIIKKPMDLNTVLKKLKNLSYNSKQEFVDDLMLIWSNCLTYNADPKHFIRAHAIAMQKKSLKLIPLIPEITIKNRSEIEKEEEDNEIKKEEEDEEGGGAGKKSAKKGRKRTRQDELKADAVGSNNGTSSPSRVGTPIAVDSDDLSNNNDQINFQTNGSTAVHEDEEDEDEDNDNLNNGALAVSNGSAENEDEEEFDPELQAWRTLTAKSRANYCESRSNLFDSKLHLKSDAPAILRKSHEMANFNQYLSNKEVISKSTNLLENDEPYLMEYDVTGGIPGFEFSGFNEEEEEKAENKLVDIILQQSNGDASKIQSDFILSNKTGLNKVYFENISEIQEIRKICFKISLIRQLQTQQFIHHTQMKQPEIESLKEVDVDSISKLSNHDSNTHKVQYAVLRRNIAKIAMQTGFETTEAPAINTLAQVAEKYIGNIAKSMKLHSETNSKNKLNAREILLLSLLENGVDKPDDLYTFIQERILKQKDKLKDLRSALSNFLKDLLRPGLENFNEKNFDDNSEQFITGDFSNDLGDDFFGFKELGLDKELNMLSSSIPIHLLHSRLHNQYISNGSSTKQNKYEDLNEYEPSSLKASDVNLQIGLLVPFYEKLLEKSKQQYIKNQKKKGESLDLPPDSEFYLIEDDELPQKQRNIRPKLPPTGKITSIKKKIIANSFFVPEILEEEEETEEKVDGDEPKNPPKVEEKAIDDKNDETAMKKKSLDAHEDKVKEDSQEKSKKDENNNDDNDDSNRKSFSSEKSLEVPNEAVDTADM